MKRDDVGLLASEVADLTIAISYVAMRRAVKPVAANFVAAIILIRNCIEISSFGQGLMERRIKDRNLRKAGAEQLTRGLNAFNVSRVVQWSEFDAVLDSAKHFICYQNGMSKSLASVHHAVTNSM